MALRSRVKELEAQLAAAGLGPQSADAPSSAYSHMQPLDRDKSPGQTSHGGFSDVGSNWENLGTFTITGTELVVELTDYADQYVIADAIRIAKM